jgi:hypothetical protein
MPGLQSELSEEESPPIFDNAAYTSSGPTSQLAVFRERQHSASAATHILIASQSYVSATNMVSFEQHKIVAQLFDSNGGRPITGWGDRKPATLLHTGGFQSTRMRRKHETIDDVFGRQFG